MKSFRAKLNILKIGEGELELQFSAPLILNPCQHYYREQRRFMSFFRNEIWIRTFHGKTNGNTSVKVICKKKNESS